MVPDTYAESHMGHAARASEAAANKASVGKTAKYGALYITHVFFLLQSRQQAHGVNRPLN